MSRLFELTDDDIADLAREINARPDVDIASIVREALALLGARGAAPPPLPPSLHDYWGPRGFVLDSPVAPGVDYYRLVNEDTEADEALAAGEPPLHGHRGMSPVELEQQRMLQWEGPNRLFNRTTDGRVESMDDPDDGTFVPLWNSEGDTGGPVERERLLEHLLRTDPDLLREPGVLPQPIESLRKTSAAPGRADLAAAFRPARADLTRRVAGGESIFDNHDRMQERAVRGIPSQREGDIAVPSFMEQPTRSFPMPGVIPLDSGPTTPPDMPHDLLPMGRPPVERASGVIPLAQAWPQLLGRTV